MIINNNLRLIPIFDRNFDKKTDKLYEPLRNAIGNTQTKPSSLMKKVDIQSQIQRIKTFLIQTSKQIDSILIPINKKLKATSNQNTILRAKARSFRTLSVQNKVGTPIKEDLFKKYAHTQPYFQQIVYDYQNTETNSIKSSYQQQNNPKQSPAMNRTRSMTSLFPTFYSIDNQTIQNKPFAPFTQTMPSKSTSFQSSEQRQSKNPQPKSPRNTILHINANKGKQINQDYCMQQYYQDSKKYRFKKQSIKTNAKQYDKNSINKSNDYKYNLFNMLDQQVNQKCSMKMCTQNQVIASKVKNNW